MLWRAVAIAGYTLLNLNLTTCRSNSGGELPTSPEPGAAPSSTSGDKARRTPSASLPGVDGSALTSAERDKLAQYLSELLAPCSDQPVTLEQCIQEHRPCDDCLRGANFLVGRVRRGDTRELAEQAFRARFAADAVKPIDVSNSPWKGASNASVVVVEWADFECPYCRVTQPVLEQLLKEFPGELKLVFKNYPLPAHTNGEAAAKAALAARKQGKFWKMHEALFSPGQNLDKASLFALAKNLGLDMERFRKDFEAPELGSEIAVDKEQAQKLGLKGTPMIFINGREFNLEQFDLAEDLVPWIELEIEKHSNKAQAAPEGTTGSTAKPSSAGSAASIAK